MTSTGIVAMPFSTRNWPGSPERRRSATGAWTIDLFRFIDWVLHLPKELDIRLQEEIVAFEESKKMPYISSIERIGEERGLQKGQAGLLIEMLQERFGLVPEPVRQQVASAALDEIHAWARKLFKADSLQAVFQ